MSVIGPRQTRARGQRPGEARPPDSGVLRPETLPPLRAALAAACWAAVRRVEWHALRPLVLFVLAFHALVAAILLAHGLPVGYLPPGQIYLTVIFSVGVLGCVVHVLAAQITADLCRVRSGRPVTPLRQRAAQAAQLTAAGLVLAAIFPVVMLANANLKPALFVINPARWDAALEEMERGLFGGVLPSEWLVRHSPPALLHFWDHVYSMFALFLLVSLMIVLYREGLRGGARYIAALGAGLLLTLLVSLACPSRGPLYEHPDWFAPLYGTKTGELAADLATSVQQYAARPAVRYPVAGISAMPSFHVLAWVVAWLLCWRPLPRWAAGLGLALLGLNWVSTVVLGWHYALDGLAAIALAISACWLARGLIPGPPASEAAQTPPRGPRTASPPPPVLRSAAHRT